jgi:hypothetical protein
MKCISPLTHRPEFEGKYNCTHCSRERLENMERADKIAKEYGCDFSPTGMYLCVYRDGEHILDKLNVCGVCIFLEDSPINYGEIKPTSYDADCDDCGLDSRLYVRCD